MIRTLLISSTLLALASVASAAEVKVSLSGKTEATIQAEIAQAAKTVCTDAPVAEYAPCVQETYQQAMARVAKFKAIKSASLTF